jgi:hypothetical protein
MNEAGDTTNLESVKETLAPAGPDAALVLARSVGKTYQHPHGAHASCRLRICRNWPACECAAEPRDEFAPSHRLYPKARHQGVGIAKGEGRALRQKRPAQVGVGSDSVIRLCRLDVRFARKRTRLGDL